MTDAAPSRPLSDLRPLWYDFIMADPPWLFRNRSAAGEAKNASAHYRCMPIDEIQALPVRDLAARDCVLWLWATNPTLDQAIDTVRAWGFTFKTAGHWVKRTKTGKLGFGTGYILRSAGEPFLIATLGEPVFAKNVRSVIEGELREHSRKPEEAYVEAARMCPKAIRRLDLFSRQVRPGWDWFGDEADKFTA